MKRPLLDSRRGLALAAVSLLAMGMAIWLPYALAAGVILAAGFVFLGPRTLLLALLDLETTEEEETASGAEAPPQAVGPRIDPALLAQAIHHAPLGVAITDTKSRYVYVNPQFCRQTEYSSEQLLGETPRLLRSLRTPDALYQEIWRTVYGRRPWHGEMVRNKKSGEEFCETTTVVPLIEDDEIAGFLMVSVDSTEQRRLEAQLRTALSTDNVTGLPSRRAIFDEYHREFERAGRYARPLTVALVELDHFSMITDSFGQFAADRVLKAFAERARDLLRKQDQLGSLGGHGFCCLLPETTEQGAAIALARLSEMIVNSPFQLGTEQLRLSITVGIAELDRGDTPVSLLNRADQALHNAKECAMEAHQPAAVTVSPRVGRAPQNQDTLTNSPALP